MRAHALLLLLLLLSPALASIDKQLSLAHKLRASGDISGAISSLRAIVAKHPHNPRALALLGDSLFESGDANAAHDVYSACAAALPDDISCADGLSMLYLRTGNPQLALPLLLKITAAVSGGGALINLGIAYKSLRRYDDALLTYAKVLEADPGDWKALYNSGNCYFEMGQWTHSVDMYKRALKIKPHHPDATNNMQKAQNVLEKAVKKHPGNAPLLVNLASNLEPPVNSDRALQLFDQAIAADPGLMEAYTNRASVFTTRKEYNLALVDLQKAISLSPNSARVYTGLGNALLSLNREEEAQSAFDHAVSLDPLENGALGALGGWAARDKRLKEAEAYYRRAIEADDSIAAWHINLAVLLNDQKRNEEARVLLKRAVTLAPQDSIAYNNYGSVLHGLGLLDEALKEYEIALKLQPNSTLVYFNLGNIYLEKGYMENAQLLLTSMHMYVNVISLDPLYRGAFNNLGNALKEADFFDHAIRAWNAALRMLPTDVDVFANLMHLRMHLCDWTNRDRRFSALKRTIEMQRSAGNRSVSVQPFHALLYPLEPETMLAVAQAAAAEVERAVRHTPPLHDPVMELNLPLRIGYISHDMGDHPTGHLWQGLPSLHSSRVAIKFYALNAGESSPYWRRLQRSKWPLQSFTGVSFRDAAATINSDRIRVLIDMDVWMKGRRPEILALRPAATQLTFLGYCGTSGAAWIDGAVMDRVVMPPEHAHIFSERLLLMPRTYQVNDYPGFYKNDVPSDFAVHRSEHNLAESKVVLANFNQLYKIDPHTLSLWSQVLYSCPKCVMWLLAFPYHAKENMLKELRHRNVSMSQVVMGDRIDKQKHLGRIGAADLFLDNLWVNAHTTATETLWAGVPVLSTPNIPLASRVASSLLLASDLPELVARNANDYLHIAKRLVSHPRIIRGLQKSLFI